MPAIEDSPDGLDEADTPRGRRDELARGTAHMFAGRVLGNVGFFAAVWLLATALTPAGRGAIAFVIVSASITARVVTIGVSVAVTVFAAQQHEVRAALATNLMLFNLLTGVVGGALICVLLIVIPGALPPSADGIAVVAIGVGTVAATVAEAAFALLLGCSRFRAFGVTGAAAPWVYAAVLAVFWQAGTLTVAAAALIWAITNLVTGVASAAVALRVTGIARPDWPLLDRSIRYGLRAWTGSLARFLNFRSDQLLVSFLAGEAVLGVYAVAVNASEVLLYLPAAIFTTLIPLAAESAAPERLQTTLQAFRLLAITTFASIAVAALAAPPLLPLVFGEAYDGSVEPFLLLLPGAIGFAMLGIFSSALLAAAAPGRSSLGTIVALVVGLVLDLALIPPYGASGAALAASVAFLLGGVVAMIALRRIEPFGLGELWPRVSDVRAFGRFVRGRTFQR